MVLFDENPVTLIRQTTLNFHTHSDLASLSRITSSLSTLRSARALRLDASRSLSTRLERQHARATAAAAAAAPTDPDAAAQQVMKLDAARFRAAKDASEALAECERREAELRAARRGLAGVREMENEEDGGQATDGEAVLRLKVYRSLGIDAEADEDGEFRRAVVRNRLRGDVSVVNLDGGCDRAFYAGHFWGCL